MPQRCLPHPRHRVPRAAGHRLPLLSALSALCLLAAAPAAQAADYQWLGQVDTLWFSNATVVGGVARHNWNPAGPPASFLNPSVFIDSDAGRASKVQLSPGSQVAATPACTGIVCGSWGATVGHLAIDTGDTLVIGGSGAFSDSFQYAYGGARVELKNPGQPVTLLNNGLLRLSAGSGRYALIGVDGVATLAGNGQTVLDNGYASTDLRAGDNGSHNARQIFYGMNGYGDRLVVAAGHTLRGRGQVGQQNYQNALLLDNAGLIRAEAGGLLTLQDAAVAAPRTHAIVNTGTLLAAEGATLAINGGVANTGGRIEAADASFVHLAAGANGGILATSGSGVIRTVATVAYPMLDGGAQLQGRLQVPAGTRLGLGGSLVNDGVIDIGTAAASVGSAGGTSDLRLFSDTLISGTGQIVMADRQATRNLFTGYSGFIGRAPVLTLGPGQTVSGAGVLGGSSTASRTLDLVNQGSILADGANGMVFAAANSFVNEGLVRVSTSLQVAGRNLTNHQRLEVLAGGAMYGTATQAAGHMTIDGSADTLLLTGGLLDGTGSIGNLTQTGGTYAPGHSPGAMEIVGDYRLDGGQLVLEIDGDGAGQADQLRVGGSFDSGGGTVLIDLSDYQGSGGLSFAGLLSAGSLQGTPTLQVLGLPASRVQAVWNGGSLDLSVSAVPEPGQAALLAAGLLALGQLARRRSRQPR